MAIMLVVAVSAAGLFLGRLADDDAADEKVVAENSRGANVDVKPSSELGSRTASKTGLASSPSAALRPDSDSSPDGSTAASDQRAGAGGEARVMAAGDEQAVESSERAVAAPGSASSSTVAGSGARAAAPVKGLGAAAPPITRAPGGADTSDARVAEAAAIQQQVARRPTLPENPRVSVIAVGEPLLASAAEAALESQLARHGLDLYDERGILELRDAGGAMALGPSEILDIVAQRGVDVLVLIEVEPLRERDLNALGRYASATTSRVRVDAFLAAAGDGIGRGWSQQVEYAEANAERQADSTMGRVSTEVADAIAAAWDSYRAGAR
jgi:hypothetical protein